jgi:hypothetical protein|tara:strand:- start:1294 stop:1560 length:267 start_codon:yes stop_codon:yes gene_type:complete
MAQGAIHLMANAPKLIVVFLLFFLTACSEFALLASGSGIAVSQNAYVKAYNGLDVLTIMATEKDIKKHIYEKSKTYINSSSEKFSRTH